MNKEVQIHLLWVDQRRIVYGNALILMKMAVCDPMYGLHLPNPLDLKLTVSQHEETDMNKFNTIGVDLAKNVIQVSVVSKDNKKLQNKELTRKKFTEFLAKQKPSLIAFEACATAHYWSRVAIRHGHEAKIIPAKAITPFRQGHKTDKNDALTVAEAAKRPNIKVAPRKEIEQQGMQAIQRSRELLIHERTALSNHIRDY